MPRVRRHEHKRHVAPQTSLSFGNAKLLPLMHFYLFITLVHTTQIEPSQHVNFYYTLDQGYARLSTNFRIVALYVQPWLVASLTPHCTTKGCTSVVQTERTMHGDCGAFIC